ncbi:MAG: hypothetical protein HOP12_14885 [Candidatus Eisenbacteria bacterium]|uniref:Uncharacterized protein n=1 Tax=Eiseniibacteriota bacterium TaxID=2212470 RepID=A0A849SI51_UNCEI|nr:hypothetical protein [Candidatus Eisenbacteria bacterium]
MLGVRTDEGLEFRFRPQGFGRFFSAAFLSVWLMGWAVGEAVASWVLFRGARALLAGEPLAQQVSPQSPAAMLGIGLFLLFWLAFWTLGGIAAIGALLEAVWAEDRLIVNAEGLRRVRSRGPFRSTQQIAREELRRVSLARRFQRLVAETDRKSIELTGLGTPAERTAAHEAITKELRLDSMSAQRLGQVLPEAWEDTVSPEGERVVIPRAWKWLARLRTEWRLGSRRITLRRRVGSNVRDLFEGQSLELTVRNDSDGDDWFALEAIGHSLDTARASAGGGPVRRKLASSLHDPAVPKQLGEWLSRVCDLPLEDRTGERTTAVDLTQLRQQLESSGALGRVASKWIDRMVTPKS